jgi:hypothetical protein
VLSLIAYAIQLNGGSLWIVWPLVLAGLILLGSVLFLRRPRFLLPPGFLQDHDRRHAHDAA